MAHSNSSINTYLYCQRKYWHAYVNNTKPCKPPSPDLQFGSFAHEVLENAGRVRDEIADGVRDDSTADYTPIIPSELLQVELKNHFGIRKWSTYFMPVIRQVYEYEKYFVEELSNNGPVTIEREIKLYINATDLPSMKGIDNFVQYDILTPLVGVIDLLIRNDKEAVILDYKFSTKRKDQSNFDMDSQLYIYAMLVSHRYNIPLSEIRVGYIDIPKEDSVIPTVLSNGTLSRAKSQNVLPEQYKAAVKAIHGDDAYYNCDKGGYYYGVYNNLQHVKAAYLAYQYVDMAAYNSIIPDVIATVTQIEQSALHKNKMRYLPKLDSYSCKSCEYLDACKPWIGGFQND